MDVLHNVSYGYNARIALKIACRLLLGSGFAGNGVNHSTVPMAGKDVHIAQKG